MVISFGTSALSQTATSWSHLKTEQGIEIYVQVQNCSGNDTYIFKIENTNSASKSIDLTITIPGEMAYGAMDFNEQLAAGSENLTSCSNATISLAKDNSASPDFSVIQVSLTIN